MRTAQRSVPLADYNNQNSEVISRAFTANLVIEERQILTHFLFYNTDRYDILIKRKWFEKTKVLIDCCNQKLIWSEKAQYQASKDLVVSRREIQLLKPKPEHQADTEQRNDLHEAVTSTQILWRTENNSHWFISSALRKSVLQLRAQSKAEKAQQQISTSETERQLNERKDSMNQTHSLTNKDQSSLNANRRKNLKPSLYQVVDIALLEADNFLHNCQDHA